MSILLEQFKKALSSQATSAEQYQILSAILDNYPPEKELGKYAVDACYRLAGENLDSFVYLQDIPSLDSTAKFQILAWDKDPAIQEEEEQEGNEDNDYSPEPAYSKSGYKRGKEKQVEQFVTLCSQGMTVNDALFQSGVDDLPVKKEIYEQEQLAKVKAAQKTLRMQITNCFGEKDNDLYRNACCSVAQYYNIVRTCEKYEENIYHFHPSKRLGHGPYQLRGSRDIPQQDVLHDIRDNSNELGYALQKTSEEYQSGDFILVNGKRKEKTPEMTNSITGFLASLMHDNNHTMLQDLRNFCEAYHQYKPFEFSKDIYNL